ncbi:hypothetical protein A6R68_08853 [Neotoma lepida]|uniref:Uncharacterized protein n=1 Tax=Neotoma lepida TaxID=56216 RepID=A0A1A6G1G9_NEOLE|nr:hypothetical protein A6R68_08853 [Neotoma lepida]
MQPDLGVRVRMSEPVPPQDSLYHPLTHLDHGPWGMHVYVRNLGSALAAAAMVSSRLTQKKISFCSQLSVPFGPN